MACRADGIISAQPQAPLPRKSLAAMDLTTLFTLCLTLPWPLATCLQGQGWDLPPSAGKPTIPGHFSCFKAIKMSSTGFLNKLQPSFQVSLAPLLWRVMWHNKPKPLVLWCRKQESCSSVHAAQPLPLQGHPDVLFDHRPSAHLEDAALSQTPRLGKCLTLSSGKQEYA